MGVTMYMHANIQNEEHLQPFSATQSAGEFVLHKLLGTILGELNVSLHQDTTEEWYTHIRKMHTMHCGNLS